MLLIVSFAIFFLLALVPGNAAITLAGGVSATPAQIAHVTAELHLNDPLLVQYWHWLDNALHGNLGTSISTGQMGPARRRQRIVLQCDIPSP